MKHDSIMLYRWRQQHEEQEITVPWAEITEAVGVRLAWIKAQPRHLCQLMVERIYDQETLEHRWSALYVEFYDSGCLVDYHLKWAK
jgi:hypothetical protein